MNTKAYYIACLLLLCFTATYAQESQPSVYDRVYRLPGKLLDGLTGRVNKVQQNILKQTEKYCRQLARSEKALKKKLARKDSAAANKIFGNTDSIYQQFSNRIQQSAGNNNNAFTNNYSPRLDSLTTAVQFLDKTGVIGQSAQSAQQVKELLTKYSELQGVLNNADVVKQLLAERQQMLQQQLQQWQLPGLQQLRKHLYYYQAQMDACKQLWEDPSVLEQKLASLLCKIPQFRQFFDQYSGLGAVFQLPGNTNPMAANSSLQTRDALNQFLQANNSGNLNLQAQLQNNLPAPTQLNSLNESLLNSPSTGELVPQQREGGGEALPGFKPNHQKVKSFLKRIELGTNIQTTKSSYLFPATSDIALSAGYRLNDKSIVGIGAGGKIGWGKGWNNIDVTGQGISLRSFLDYKIKGNWWLSGGWEYHYQQPVVVVRELQKIDHWKQAGLLGLTKIVPVKMKTFKKYRLQVYYDFLYQYKLPATEPVKFRMGYTF
ncbi:hypothetical protein HB364_24940 [Pseudoflavitalea sp. X16]|uniref:hypothetical protein n=1 Tax=Paraflavitalea devenefica TaxID=2716334 RepID=UPI0014205AA9|nr:hypothetical protein [Paraflavitalea devenefica]NII28353.1 hypothetical protein [Paraflavitalea devenefica]